MRVTSAVWMLVCCLLIGLGSACRDRPAETRESGTPGRRGEVRIAVLSPALAEMLVDFGLQKRIVGRHGWDMVLPKSVRVVGDQQGVDYEALLRVRPTHVLLQWGQRPLPERLVRLGQEQGWEIRNYEVLTLDDIERTATDLFGLFALAGDHGKGSEMSPLFVPPAERLARAWKEDERLADAGRILLLHGVAPAAALGPGSFHHQLLERMGGQPAIEEGRPHMVLDAEDVLRLAPDGIIVIAPRAFGSEPRPRPSGEELRRMLGRVGELDVPAAKAGRIAVIDDPLGLLPGMSIVDVAREMREILEGWAR